MKNTLYIAAIGLASILGCNETVSPPTDLESQQRVMCEPSQRDLRVNSIRTEIRYNKITPLDEVDLIRIEMIYNKMTSPDYKEITPTKSN